MASGQIALYTMFLMTGGMIVPYVWGCFFLDEKLTAARIAGIFVITGAVIALNAGKTRPGVKQLLLCTAAFFLNGFGSIASKLHQITTVYDTVQSDTGFVMLTGLSYVLLCSLGLIFNSIINKAPSKKVPWKKVLPLGILSAALGGGGVLCQMIGAKTVGATVLFPVISGGAIVFSAFAGWIFFKEKPSKRMWICIAACVVGTCMFL